MSKKPYVVKMMVEVEMLSDLTAAESPEEAVQKVYLRTNFKKLLDNCLGDPYIVSTEFTGTINSAIVMELDLDDQNLEPEEVIEFDGQSLSTTILKGLPTKH